MAWLPEYSTSRPLFYVGERPVTATLFLIGLHVVGLLFVTAALRLNHAMEWTTPLMFSNLEVFQYKKIWQWVTYAFLNTPSFVFLFDMLILYFFGKPLEEALGVRRFLAFYFTLVTMAPILFTFIAPWYPIHLEGALAAHFGLVVAMAMIYPDSETFFFQIPLRIVMAILFALYTLQFLAYGKTSELLNLWLTSAIAWGAIRYYQGESFGWIADLRDKLYAKRHQIQVVKSGEPKEPEISQLDDVLEKISKHGMKSLSDAEKAFLEKTRQELLDKEIRK